MSKRVSKRVREEAAHYCALMASSDRWFRVAIWSEPAVDFEDASGIECFKENGSAALARQAYWHACEFSWLDWQGREAWAEAEALLRTGWVPW